MAEMESLPEHKEAVAKERCNRLLAFANVTQTVCGGFELEPLTLERYTSLRIADSPLIRMQIPTPSQLETFLWIMSPQYAFRKLPLVRCLFSRKCAKVFSPSSRPWFFYNTWAKKEAAKILNAKCIIDSILSTFAQVFQDAPKPSKEGKSYYDLAISIVGTIARNYGWSEEAILRKPLSRLLQYRRECLENEALQISLEHGGKFISPLDNPSDAVKMRHAVEFGKRVAAEQQSKN